MVVACLLLVSLLAACSLLVRLLVRLLVTRLIACSRDVPGVCWRPVRVVRIPNSDVISFPASTRPPSRQHETGGKHVPARKLAGAWIL